MINFREIIRRLLKYLILVLVLGFSIYTIPKNKISNSELLWVILIVGMTFCILDIVTPSIQIIVNKDTDSESDSESESE
jgi:cell division protein FtsW (lipid II flippase)